MPCARNSAISSRSAKDRRRPESGPDDRDRCDGAIPPASRNQRNPTGCDVPTSTAASSLDKPSAMNAQNRRRCSRNPTPGRPGDLNLPRKARSDHRRPAIAPPPVPVLRRPVEPTEYLSSDAPLTTFMSEVDRERRRTCCLSIDPTVGHAPPVTCD